MIGLTPSGRPDALAWLNSIFDAGNIPRSFELDPCRECSASIVVWVDENDRVPLPEVDRDIIDQAQSLLPFTERTVVASMDQSFVLRARAYGIEAVLVRDDDIPPRSSTL